MQESKPGNDHVDPLNDQKEKFLLPQQYFLKQEDDNKIKKNINYEI